MKKMLLALFLVGLLSNVSNAQTFNCLVGNYEGEIENLNNGLIYDPVELVIFYDSAYQENSNLFFNINYPNDGVVSFYDMNTDSITFLWLQVVYAGIRTYQSQSFSIETLSEDSLVLKNDLFHAKYSRITSLDGNCSGLDTASTGGNNGVNGSVGFEELRSSKDHEIVKILTMLGQEVKPNDTENYKNQVLIYIFSDGTSKKVFQTE